MRSVPLPRPFRACHAAIALAFALAAAAPVARPVFAQDRDDPVAVVPPELSEEARKAYTRGIREAKDLIASKQYGAATTRIEALLRQRPREAQARFLYGVVQTERGDGKAAIATFRAMTEDYPELPEPYNNLAVLYAQKGDYPAARIALEAALGAAPDWAVAHENLGDVYARLAAAEYDRAAALDKSSKTATAKLTLARQLLAPK